jgi:hypothetical protein
MEFLTFVGFITVYWCITMVVVFLVAILSGSTNEEKCLQSVKNKYPGCKILHVPGHPFRFYVFVGEEMHLVRTVNLTNCEISSDELCKELGR